MLPLVQGLQHIDNEKLASMRQQEYYDMTKSKKRQLFDPLGRARSIKINGYPHNLISDLTKLNLKRENIGKTIT